MDGSGDSQTEERKPDKDRYQTVSLTCGIYTKDTNELIYKTEIGSQT